MVEPGTPAAQWALTLSGKKHTLQDAPSQIALAARAAMVRHPGLGPAIFFACSFEGTRRPARAQSS